MKALRSARRLNDIPAVFQTLRDQGIEVNGPYRISSGTLIYTLANCIVTERELLDLAKTGKLNAAGVSELSAKVMKNGA